MRSAVWRDTRELPIPQRCCMDGDYSMIAVRSEWSTKEVLRVVLPGLPPRQDQPRCCKALVHAVGHAASTPLCSPCPLQFEGQDPAPRHLQYGLRKQARALGCQFAAPSSNGAFVNVPHHAPVSPFGQQQMPVGLISGTNRPCGGAEQDRSEQPLPHLIGSASVGAGQFSLPSTTKRRIARANRWPS